MKNMAKNILTVSIISLVVSSVGMASPEKGLEIAKKVDAADSGWKDEQLTAVMTLRSANGKEVTRVIRTRSLEVKGDGDMSLTIFDRPADVKGTVFLTHSHRRGNDDQWLFLPALRRVKRISSSNRSGPFMGSEFAFEDIVSEEVERYTYNFLKEEKCSGGQSCYVYERFPVDKNSGYSRQIVYVDKEHLRIHKVEYFDRKKDHLKTLERKDYKQFGKFWRADNWKMVNHLRKKSTTIIWNERKFNTGLTARDFSKNAIKRYK